MIVFAASHQVELVHLANCAERTLARGAATGVSFSPDGRWVAYSRSVNSRLRGPFVVSVRGGRIRSPLGSGILAWKWGPKNELLYGLTHSGSLVAGSPAGARRIVAAHLGTAFYDVPFVISPDDRQAVVNHSSCFRPAGELDTIDLQTGAQAVSLKQPGRYFTLAGFSPDGRWVLFWSASECSSSLAADGWPLYAVPVGGGQPVRAVSHMLLYQDFLTWCGESLIAAAGPDRETQTGSALLEARPPAWRKHTIRSARKRSWVSPACAPSGRELAVAAGPSNAPVSFGLEHRSIWLLRPDGAVVRRLTSPPARAFSDEAPRFSRIAPWILFVQSRVVTPRYDAARGEFPQPISRDTIDLVSTAGGSSVPIMEFTSNDPSYYDHFGWAEQLDWSQGN